MEFNSGHIRVLFILASKGGPVQKRVISHATARWNARNRDRVLRELVSEDQVVVQVLPGTGRPPGNYYWLTPAGIETVEALDEAGDIQPLPTGWRETYAQ